MNSAILTPSRRFAGAKELAVAALIILRQRSKAGFWRAKGWAGGASLRYQPTLDGGLQKRSQFKMPRGHSIVEGIRQADGVGKARAVRKHD